MSEITEEQISQCLGRIRDINMDCTLEAASSIRECVVNEGGVSLTIELGYPAEGYRRKLTQDIEAELEKIGVRQSEIKIETRILSRSVQKGVPLLAGVKNMIAIASGKGGVGKSTTAINLALALQAEGANVGLLDADIYGPSQPRMLGCRGRPESTDGKNVEPLLSYHLQTMSIGYLIAEDTPMIWRGPMVTSALEQLLNDTQWRDLDYLIIDLPPGTGDIQLTLCQKIPVSGALIVTTPQDIALIDAKKALKMFEKVEVPVLGIIENMSLYTCSQCGHEEAIFGEGGGQQMASQYGIDLLGAMPLDRAIREGVDNGKPTVAMAPDSHITRIYREIARRASAKLSLQAKDYSSKFPKIVVQND